MARGFPAPSAEQQDEFLELIGKGKTRQEAAETVGGTSTMFRTFMNGQGEDSVAFAERYMAVLEDTGKAPAPHIQKIRELEGVHLAHRLLDELVMRALDSERGKSGASNRVLHNLALLKLEDFKPLLEARVRHTHDGAVGIYALPQLDLDKWTLEQAEEWQALEDRRNELIEIARPDSVSGNFHQKQIAAARIAVADKNGRVPIDAHGEVIDVEAVEIVE